MTDFRYTLSAGTMLRGPELTYTIESVLGQGGFGITYLATATAIIGSIPQEIRFAIKEHFVAELCERDAITHSVHYSNPVADKVKRSRRDFISEAQRLKKLGISHPNLVRINEVFEANNTAYFVMEYLGDMTLGRYVRERGRLTLDETRKMMLPIIEAVAMLHDNKVAHYDIKPTNIMLPIRKGDVQRPVLIDFGLAKHYDESGNATSTLGTGGYSEGYAPIEQSHGVSTFSPGCDIYSLAATVYFCLTGQRPPLAHEATPDMLRAVLSQNQEITPRTAGAIISGMSMLASQRTADARSLARDIFGDNPTTDKTVISGIEKERFRPVSGEKTFEIDISYQLSNPTEKPNVKSAAKKSGSAGLYTLFGIVFLCVVGGIIYFAFDTKDKSSTDRSALYAPSTAGINIDNGPTAHIPSTTLPDENYEHLDMCVEYDGKYGTFNVDEWSRLSTDEQALYSKVGLVIYTAGHDFILDKDEGPDLSLYKGRTWCDNKGLLLPLKEDLLVISRNFSDINDALRAYGMDELSSEGYWSEEEQLVAYVINPATGQIRDGNAIYPAGIRGITGTPIVR